MQMLDELKFDSNGLIPAIIQDYENNDVLMMGYMNREAVRRTLESGRVTFWSRSRQKYWVKGETSGHTQDVRSLAFDCDADTLLIKVVQKGGACHVGYRSCFFREVSPNGNSARIVGTKVFDPGAVYS
ncbi:MAG: phosphoribosyl-AMP cyclohydrolase [Candidatus Poribacteria bacterium]|nr:phosphoribosyl-AMP cyclohydrolase [Candidatus Poribacteria bacterium]